MNLPGGGKGSVSEDHISKLKTGFGKKNLIK
jgi:hypothetical protein